VVSDVHVRRCGALFLPLVIVAAGVILLLNTTGVLDWSTWSELAKFWPIAVILFGLTLVWNRFRDRT